MSSILYSTAENRVGSLAQRVHLQHLEGVQKPLSAIAGIAIVAGLLITAGNALGLLISNTDSAAPAGIFRVVSRDFRRGDLVAVCLPFAIAQQGLVRGYLRIGSCVGNAEPVGKIAAALPGDIVDIEPTRTSVNGVLFKRSAVAIHDSKGRALPHVAWGKHRVAAGEVWLFGFNNRRSWDSRYFGPIPLANIRGEIKPVITW